MLFKIITIAFLLREALHQSVLLLLSDCRYSLYVRVRLVDRLQREAGCQASRGDPLATWCCLSHVMSHAAMHAEFYRLQMLLDCWCGGCL